MRKELMRNHSRSIYFCFECVKLKNEKAIRKSVSFHLKKIKTVYNIDLIVEFLKNINE